MRFWPGEDVIVDFEGREHPGEVIRQSAGYVMCVIHLDPVWDYGAQAARLDPEATVCVKESHVRHAQ